MRDLTRIPEVMLQERSESLGDALPQTVTVKLSKQLATYLVTQAEVYDRDIEYIARQMLEMWAEDWVKTTLAVYESLQAGKAAGAEQPKKRNEHYYKCELAAALRLSGLNIRTEYHTGSGDADIAVMSANGKDVRAIVEVKLALRNWRECHQATGQAKAYAEATGAVDWFVVAPSIEDERLLVDGVHTYDGAAERIVKALRKAA